MGTGGTLEGAPRAFRGAHPSADSGLQAVACHRWPSSGKTPVRGDVACNPPPYCNGRGTCHILGQGVLRHRVGAWALIEQHCLRGGGR
jgi:hypothetical protein